VGFGASGDWETQLLSIKGTSEVNVNIVGSGAMKQQEGGSIRFF